MAHLHDGRQRLGGPSEQAACPWGDTWAAVERGNRYGNADWDALVAVESRLPMGDLRRIGAADPPFPRARAQCALAYCNHKRARQPQRFATQGAALAAPGSHRW